MALALGMMYAPYQEASENAPVIDFNFPPSVLRDTGWLAAEYDSSTPSSMRQVHSDG